MRAESLEFEDQAAFRPLAEIALALSRKVAQIARAFFPPGATRPDRDCINMQPMSGAWLIQYEVACGKDGDAL